MSTSTFEETSPRVHAEPAASVATAARGPRGKHNTYHDRKLALDRAAALILLVPAIPAIAILVCLVKLTSPGPGIFRQRRVGRNGEVFTMYKIRTMRCDAEAVGGAQWSTGAKDPRVTRLGRWIRKLHLDEFPQLFNVLRGEMSLMGPRPERPEFVEILTKAIPGYARRHQVRPGITGLAQINLPPDSDLESVRRKLTLDMEYVERASLALDARMFLCTCLRLVGMHGHRTLQFLKVSRPIPGGACLSADGRSAEHQLTPDALEVPAVNGSTSRLGPQRQYSLDSLREERCDGHFAHKPK